MTTAQWMALAGTALLVMGAAWLSAVETVVTRLDLVRGLRLEDEEVTGGASLRWLLEHRSTALNVVLVLTVALRVAATALAVAFALALGTGTVGAAVAVLVLVVVSLVGAEIVPRTLVLRHLETAGLRLAPMAVGTVRLMAPLVRPLVGAGRGLVRGRGEVSGPYAPDDEVEAHLEAAEEGEALEEDELAMIHSIFELGDTVVREIMVPRPDMVTVEDSDPLERVVETFVQHGYSRVPVYRHDTDEVVGIVYAKDVLKRLFLAPETDAWSDLVRAPTFVPETKRIDDLLRSLQERKVHQALVVDEYGALVGLVTIEDILEEIVGEIVDEHDREDPLVEVVDDRQVRVDARLPVDELNDLLDVELPDQAWDSVGGLVFGLLGHVPSPGESVEVDGLELTVEDMQGRRIRRILVTTGAPAAYGEPPREPAT